MALADLITLSTSPVIRVTTWQDDISIGGVTWEGGGEILDISDIQTRVDEPNERVTVTLSLADPVDFGEWLDDPGPIAVTVEKARQTAQGWSKLSAFKYTGRLSTGQIAEGAAVLEIETRKGDALEGEALTWSDEDQRRRHPSDQGLEYMRPLADQRIETAWPP